VPNERAIAIRTLRGLDSQEDFAGKLGVTRGTVIALEKGSTPSLRTARRLVEMGLDQRHVLPTNATANGPERAA
jgi:DNA-binding XRE family transcriptional regulator